MSNTIKCVIIGIVATLLVGIALWLVIVYSGSYNVAASDTHADAFRWSLDTTLRRSVARRADEVELPESFAEAPITEGARYYSESCVHCHGAPGQSPEGWSRGMRPEPPLLESAAPEWSSEEIYWIVENGIKMSGMPAFESHYDAEEIRAITAFVAGLPGLSPETYSEITGGSGENREEGE